MRIGIFLFLPARQGKFGKSEIDLAGRKPRHCRIGCRIVRGQSHRCPPRLAAVSGGACSSMVRAGRS
jgi:hypothetical protein